MTIVLHVHRRRWCYAALLCLIPATAGAEVGPLDLEQAVDHALEHHPALQVQTATEEARQAQVTLSRAGYLPDLDLSAQLNAGTGNVLRGPLFPMRDVPNVSGPPTGRSLGDAALASAVGAGVAWDAVGLLRQMARVDAALADESQSRAATDVVRLAVAYGAADQFVDVVSRAQIVSAARATVERSRVLATMVKALVDQDLRPGSDQARATAELMLASTQLVRAEQVEAVSRTALARALGAAGEKVDLRAGHLLEVPAASPSPGAGKNTALLEAEAAVRAARARKRAVDLQYLPRLDLVAALWTRGSGLTSGQLGPSPGGGLGPDTPNWAAGIVLTWPLLEMVAVRARSRVEAAQTKAAETRHRDTLQAVQSQIDSARDVLEASQRIARNTPIALQAARDAERQATARYRSGLSSIDEVAEAQRLLAQAESDDAVARLTIRRAELLLARAVGDLSPFLTGLRGGR